MKKSIKKKAELNLSDYDYLDRISLLGWMWEFARRSKDFKDYYRNFEPIKAKGNYAQLMLFASENGPIGVFALDCKDPSEKWSDKDDITYNFACGLTKCTPVIIFNLDEYDRGFNIQKKQQFINNIPYPLREVSRHLGDKNIVMALIDISSGQSIDEILQTIKPRLVSWRKEFKLPKKRSAKTPKKNKNELIKKAKIWKSYLIVYDLIKAGMLHKDASDKLSLHDEETYSSEKTIERHYKAAEKLINGGYREYL